MSDKETANKYQGGLGDRPMQHAWIRYADEQEVPHDHEDEDAFKYGFDAGRDFGAARSEASAWVPVEVGLPNEGVKCLVTVLSYGSRIPVIEAYVVYRGEDGSWYCEGDNSRYEDDVIAWMPLPSPCTADSGNGGGE